jgi:hypothetical protein
MSGYDGLLDALRANGHNVIERGDRSMAQCPAHNDRNPSLSIRRRDDGKGVLLNCHAGCDYRAVLCAIGLSDRDLFDDAELRTAYRAENTYVYPDGRRVHRKRGKSFPQSGNKNGRALFGSDRILDACLVYVAEGEKDVLAIEGIGGTAVCSAMGAGKAHLADWSPLTGLEVIVVADRDEAGRKHAAEVVALVEPIARSVKVVEAKEGKDAADHIANGYGLVEFVEASDEADKPQRGVRRSRITWACDIEPEPVVWAWKDNEHGRIPSGSLSVAAGREGTGKSSFGIWLAAQLSKGELPGSHYGKPKRVLYVAVEDSWKYTLVPRLMAAGADLSKIGRFEVVTIMEDDRESRVTLSLPADNSILQRDVAENDVALVVIDPLLSVIGGNLDTNHSRQVREALDPLVRIADETGAVLFGIAHFNKGSGSDAASRISGSGAFKDVPRSVFGFARDEENNTRVMSQVKNSLGRDDLPSLMYQIEPVVIETSKGSAETGRLLFTGESERSVADVLRESRGDSGQRQTTDQFIATYLAGAGGEAPANEVIDAGREAGYSESTVKNARKKVADTRSSGFTDKTHTWVLRSGALKTNVDTNVDPVGTKDLAVVPTGSTQYLRDPLCTLCGTALQSPLSARRGHCEECDLFPPDLAAHIEREMNK